jgi:retinol dehydrogenase-12
MVDMNGKVVVVTGATNGIGKATAQALAENGATVVIVSRSADKCAATVSELKALTNNANITSYTADLSVMGQVVNVAAEIKANYERLDVLVNNAGMWFAERQLSADGIEMTWALNHLSYFLLTNQLLGLLKSTATEHGEARVISVSSMAHHGASIAWDDFQFEDWSRARTQYPGWGAYQQSKLANVLFAYGLARRLEDTGVTSNAVHPGVVVTGFSQNNGAFFKFGAVFRRMFNRATALDGAMPSIYLASAPDARGVTGKYYGPPHKEEPSDPQTHDTAMQDRLWELSEKMTANVPV